jgi:hypothetical protein
MIDPRDTADRERAIADRISGSSHDHRRQLQPLVVPHDEQT